MLPGGRIEFETEAAKDTELAEGMERHSLIGLLRGASGRQRRSDGEP